MNDAQRIKENKRIAIAQIDTMRPMGKNCVKTSAQLKDPHEDMKWKICRQLIKEGKYFYTECFLKNGQKADILVPEDLKIIEILNSEKEKDCIVKTKTYPECFEIVMVKANQNFNERLIY